jgi:VWA domain containing CoxE-like protein
VVDDVMMRLRHRTIETLKGALNRQRRTRHPRHADIDWSRTIGANLRHYQPEHRTVAPETLIGFARKSRTRADLDHVILCVDQSGSMAPSVIYASIFAAVMASLPVISTKLVCFDTAILDLTSLSNWPIRWRCCSACSWGAAPISTPRSPIAKAGSSSRQRRILC